MIPPIMAVCLNPAQFLPSFTSQRNNPVRRTQDIGQFHGVVGAAMHQPSGKTPA
jgi:hypothetical protein